MNIWVLLGLSGVALVSGRASVKHGHRGHDEHQTTSMSSTVTEAEQENSDKIVGGNVTTILEYPYQVSLERRKVHACGGSIITSKWVLTAAHCIYGQEQVSLMRVRAGTSIRQDGGQVRKVRKTFIPRKYSYHAADYDVSLLELTKPFDLCDEVQPVTLTLPKAEPKAGDEVTVSGWGAMHMNAPNMPKQLMTVTVPVVGRTECEDAYASSQEITKRMFCAGTMGKDSCQGDSGGPLIILRDKVKVQVGIVSWGRGCALEGFPGVYTNLAYPYILHFICNHTKVCPPSEGSAHSTGHPAHSTSLPEDSTSLPEDATSTTEDSTGSVEDITSPPEDDDVTSLPEDASGMPAELTRVPDDSTSPPGDSARLTTTEDADESQGEEEEEEEDEDEATEANKDEPVHKTATTAGEVKHKDKRRNQSRH